MAQLSTKQLAAGQPFQLVNVKYVDGGVGELISRGNDYSGLKPFQLGQLEGDREVEAVLSVECFEATEDYTVSVNSDFDGKQMCAALSMDLDSILGARPPRRPK